ncbi:MAG: acyl-CoA dehydrogenase family protein [Alphaproteobacteria bacterium]|nr:acyl-CoA dehydrogenase family protein [Alphaproteobacteria bacterium]
MNFDDTPEEAAFRAEARDWLARTAPKFVTPGPDEADDAREAAYIRRAKAWQAAKAEGGYAAITWPKEFGGRGGRPIEQVIYSQEERRYSVPSGPFQIGLGMCVPTVMTWGDDAARKRFVGPAVRGEEIWCQLFSEPAAGSDLAGIRTRSEKKGDEWIVNGQKVWTSGAHYSDWGILVTRSDPSQPKHKGLTFFYLDMKSPGVEVRPIQQIWGGANFNEVYFNDVRIPDSQRFGAPGEGWKVALTMLMHERLAISAGQVTTDVKDFFELAGEIELETGPALENAAVREQIADWYVRSEGLKFTTYRALTALSRGETPGPEGSIGKVVSAPQLQALGTLGMDLGDMAGGLTEEDVAPLKAAFQRAYLFAPGLRIAGGTDEILRNIVAERVLGLPPDIRVDKSVAFNELPVGR